MPLLEYKGNRKMATKALAVVSTKGGSGKSTLVEFMSHVLRKTYRKSVTVYNLDQQIHVTVRSESNPDFIIFDTIGAFANNTLSLIEKIKEDENGMIIIPVSTGVNDQREYAFIIDKLKELGVFDKSVFVLIKVRLGSKSVKESRDLLKSMNANVAVAAISLLEDYAQERLHSSRCVNEISKFLNEITEL